MADTYFVLQALHIFRDVVILDEANECYAIYNLTTNNLSDSDNAAELEALFESAIRGDASPSPCP